MNSELKKIPVFTALNKPNLLLGAERELTLFIGLFSALLVFIALTWQTFILGIALWFGVMVLLRMMAKKDPMLSKIYLRHIKYKAFYPAHSTPFVKDN